MRVLKFTLSGENAFFKKPDVNTYLYFTYGHIHKVVLLGIFGAILGYSGYGIIKSDKDKKKDESNVEEYPEFYERLKGLKISVIPKNERGYIPKKIHTFNNSVGYANADGNLIVKEQWLEKPVWDIYVLLDCEEAECLANSLKENRCIYIPYLGKNDHPANIKEVVEIEIDEADVKETSISSLFPKSIADILPLDDEDEIEEFKYQEKLPIRLNGYTNLYEYETFCYTNIPVNVKNTILYKDKDRILAFY